MQGRQNINDLISWAADYLHENVEFFAAPFLDQKKFRSWAWKNESSFSSFSNALKDVMPNHASLNDFEFAICGSGKGYSREDVNKSLWRGKKEHIKQYLAWNPALAKMLLAWLIQWIV